MLEVIIFPISGNYFVSQMASMSMVLEARNVLPKRSFDLIFAASGGAICSVASYLFRDTFESIQRLGSRLNSNLFIQNWFQGAFRFLPSVLAFNKNGMYKNGFDVDKLMKDVVTKDFLLKDSTTESWILAYNKDIDMGSVFCTKNEEKSIISKHLDEVQLLKYGLGEIQHIDGDINILSKVVMASANIPTLKQPVEIKGNSYVDGGISRASPGSFFNDALVELHEEETYSGAVHYVYVLATKITDYDVRKSFKRTKHWITEIQEYIKNFIMSMSFTDHQMMIENWLRITNKKLSECTKTRLVHTNVNELREKLVELHDKNYFLSVFTDDASIDITNFDSSDFEREFEKAFLTVTVEICYSSL